MRGEGYSSPGDGRRGLRIPRSWLLLLLTVTGCSSRVATQGIDTTSADYPIPVEQRNVWDATERGLRWLKHSQNKDGSWGSKADEVRASTGLALLAFLWHGVMPDSGDFGPTVIRGMEFLFANMPTTNGPAGKIQAQAVGHAIAVYALCEGYATIRNPHVKDAGERGLALILTGQSDSGLWGDSYNTNEAKDSIDSSVWQVLALKAGLMAGIEMTGLRVSLNKACDAMERVVAAKPDAGTAVGALLCLQMGGRIREPVYREALDRLGTMAPDWDAPSFEDPIFRWYLATQVFYWQGGPRWVQWHRTFIPMLCQHQVVQHEGRGQDIGYWDSPGDGERFGRVSTTAMSLLLLWDRGPISYRPGYIRAPEVEANQWNETNDDVRVEIDL